MRFPNFAPLFIRLRAIPRRLARSKLVWSIAALLLIYTLGGFFLAPYLVERYVPALAQEHLGRGASVAKVAINPYTLTFEASGFRLEGGEKPLIAFDRLFVDLELSSLFRRAWTLADVRLEGANLALVIDREGRLNLLEMLERLRKPPQPDDAPPRFVLRHLAIERSIVSLSDLSGATPANVSVTPIDLELAELSTIEDAAGRYTLDAKLPGGGTLTWKGTLSLQPIASVGEIVMKGMKLETAWRFLRDELNLGQPQGELAISGHYDFGYREGKAALSMSAVRAELTGLSVGLRDEKRPLLALRTVRVGDATLDLAKREIVVDKVLLAEGALSASVSEGGAIDWQRIGPAPATAAASEPAPPKERAQAPKTPPWHIRLPGIAVENVAIDYADHSRKPALALRTVLEGGLDLDITTGAGPARIVAEQLRLALASISLTATKSDAPLATLDALTLSGGRVDSRERVLHAKSIELSGGAVSIARGRDGQTGLLAALFPAQAKPAARADASTTSTAADAWRYRVDALALKDVAVALADQTYSPAIAYDVKVATVTANNVDPASKKPIAFTAALRVGTGGTATAEGTLAQDFGAVRARVALARIPLEPLRPLLAKHATLELKSGELASKARVTYRRGAEPALTARGQVSVGDVLVNETGSGDRFASWKTLAAEGVALSLSPDRLAVRQVRVLDPGAKIVIAKDRTINLTRVIRSEALESEAAKAPAAERPPAFPYEIGTIRLEGGTLDFADLSLVLPFATQVQALGGAIVGITSDPKAKAELKLSGQVDKYGEARAAGVLIPRDPKAFLDITARFNNVDMPLLSPYSATFAGRKVASGKLSVVLEYKIVNSQLAGENRIVLREFKLGERVDAPNAMDLPLDLAVALLKDSEGRISLAVPVRGNVGSPEFDYGKVIRAAIANAIGRIVTAPFRALAGLFGKKDVDEVRTVRFAPGSAELAPAQREQLDALAKALKERPQLKLVVKGPYDAERDARQLKRNQARLELARRLRAKLEPGEDPGPIAYARVDTQKALEELLTKRGGPDALADLEKSFAKRTGRQPDRVNPLLGLFGRGSKDTEFYEAVFERLVELEPLPDSAVPALAANRAQAIVDALARAGVDSTRVQPGGIVQAKPGKGRSVATELTLAAMPG